MIHTLIILFMFGSGITTTSIDFWSAASCIDAGNEIVNKLTKANVQYVCIARVK